MTIKHLLSKNYNISIYTTLWPCLSCPILWICTVKFNVFFLEKVLCPLRKISERSKAWAGWRPCCGSGGRVRNESPTGRLFYPGHPWGQLLLLPTHGNFLRNCSCWDFYFKSQVNLRLKALQSNGKVFSIISIMCPLLWKFHSSSHMPLSVLIRASECHPWKVLLNMKLWQFQGEGKTWLFCEHRCVHTYQKIEIQFRRQYWKQFEPGSNQTSAEIAREITLKMILPLFQFILYEWGHQYGMNWKTHIKFLLISSQWEQRLHVSPGDPI